MTRWTFVNGRYVRHARAAVHVEDRGYQLADGVYEVWAVRAGRLFDEERHFARLERSLGELKIAMPMERAALKIVIMETLARNRVRDGIVYLQVTRGVAPRDHAFPRPAVRPALVVTARSVNHADYEKRLRDGVAVISHPDERWARCDIKTIGLTANVMAKEAARAAGAYEAWLVDGDGNVTEGASSTAWIVDGEGKLISRSIADNILPGVTRAGVVDLAEERQMRVEERPFSLEEAKNAREAFVTGAGSLVTPVVAIDGAPVADGKPGPVTAALAQAFIESRTREY